jgi:hypothetical protein
MIDTIIKTITQKEFDSNWQPNGWNLLHIGPTFNWRTEWDEWASIRDLVQNALDETEAFTVTQTGTDLVISDKGAGLSVRDLFLGGQRPKESYMRGKFGEGLKVASLSLLRLGYGVSMQTVGKDAIFCMYQQDIDTEPISTLAVLWKNNGIKSGTAVTIHGYDFNQDTYEDRFTQTANLDLLHKSKSNVTKPRQRYNIIYKAKKGQAMIYARNIFMREIEGQWSYDLWDFELSPDRHAPRYDFQLWECVSRLWQTVTDENLMVEFFKAIRDNKAKYLKGELDMATSEWTRTPENIPYIRIMESNTEKWNRAFIKVYGECSVLRTGAFESQMEAIGHSSVALPQGITEAMRKVVKSDESLLVSMRDKIREIETIDDLNLDSRQLLILNSARELNEGLSKPVAGLFAAHLPMVDGKPIDALYHIPTDQVLFTPAMLSSWIEMFKAFVHELGHSYSGADDCTYQHAFGMTAASAELAIHIASHPNFYQRYGSVIKG